MAKTPRPIQKTPSGDFRLTLDKDHKDVLLTLLTQLRTLLSESRNDPSLRRLFPTAYHNDVAKDQEYQELMREDLFSSRIAAIETAIQFINSANDSNRDSMDSFTKSINFLRLVLGTSLDIGEDEYPIEINKALDSSEDERSNQLHLYAYLGWLLESAIQEQLNP